VRDRPEIVDPSDWAPEACTLATAELRVAEFDELFTVVLRFDRLQPTRLDLVLPRDAEATGPAACWPRPKANPSGRAASRPAELSQRNRCTRCNNVPVTSCLAGPALNEVPFAARRWTRRSVAVCLPGRAGGEEERGSRAWQSVSPRWRHPWASKDTGQPPRR
jgi:hypothetical protein